MDTFLNREELKSLWGFLAIYISSALILMIIIAILYHSNETNKIHEKRLMEIKTVIMSYEKELMRAEMDKVPYTFHSPKEFFNVALLNKEKQPLFSNANIPVFDLNTTRYTVRELSSPINDVAYIVVDEEKKNLVYEHFTKSFEKSKDKFLDKPLYNSLKLEGIKESNINIAVYYKKSTSNVLGQTYMKRTGEYSVVCAILNMWLTARALNIGMGWVSILKPKKVNKSSLASIGSFSVS